MKISYKSSSAFSRIMESTEEGDAEESAVSELRSELWVKERELTDIRLEALDSAHQLEQLREAMKNMQVCLAYCMCLCSVTCLQSFYSNLKLYSAHVSVDGGEPEGRKCQFKNRNPASPPWLWPHLLHIPAFRPGVPPGALSEAANEHVPHQILQP